MNDATIQYGRKLPRNENPIMEEHQRQLGSGVNEFMKAKREKKNISYSGDFIFKDIQFFKTELILVLILVAVTIAVVVLSAFLQVTTIDTLKPYMSQQGFDKVTEFSSTSMMYSFIGVVIPVVGFMLIFMFKYMMFYPTGHKKFVLRAWRDGGTRLSVDNVKGNTIKFDPSQTDADEVYVGNQRKNYDLVTGKGILLLEEGEFENTKLCRSNNSPEKIKDVNTIKSGVFALGRRVERHNLLHGGGFFSNPTNILLILVLVVVVIVVVLLMVKSGGSGGLMESANGLAQSLTARSG